MTTFEPGYWTYKLISDKLKTIGNIKLEANIHNNTCSITTDKTLQLKELGLLLGFPKNTTIPSGTKTNSPNNVDINQGLRYISIRSDMIDRKKNIGNYGRRSDVILTLPITNTQTLKGSIMHYRDIESRVPIQKG